MLINTLKCCSKHIGYSVFDFNLYSCGGSQRRWYNNKRTGCCTDVPQTCNRTVVEEWPKSDPPPPQWRPNCPQEMPGNNDPYRIKVPEVVVPPMVAGNVKYMGDVLTHTDPRDLKDWGAETPNQNQQMDPENQDSSPQAEEEDGSFLGKLKKFFRGGKSKDEFTEPELNSPYQYNTRIKPSIDCASRGPCAPLPPPPPPCPPIPKKPFQWIYVLATAALLVTLGVIYDVSQNSTISWHQKMDLLMTARGKTILIYKYWAFKEKQKKSGMYDTIWQPRLKARRPFYADDLPMCVQYLIIGTGAAGWAAYNAIMENDPKAKVFFITKEDILPYNRLPISKFMWWNKLPPDLKTLKYFDQKYKTMYVTKCSNFMDPEKFYRKETGPAVSIATGWSVLRLDAENHVAYIKTMSGERPIYYERCLIATGSKPNQLDIFKSAPKAVRARVTSFRTIRDLENAFRKVRAAQHVTIIGGGPLACELSWHLAMMKHKVELDEKDADKPPLQITQLYKDGGILSSILPEYLGEWAAEKIKCDGVCMLPRTTAVDAFPSKDGRLELTLSDGSSLVTDFVFSCVGMSPQTELAEPSFLEEDKENGGFLVNSELAARTHLYAAGDAASFHSQWKNTRLRFHTYMPAVEQGQLAGLNMTGYWEPCNIEQSYWFSLGDAIDMQVVGDVGACMPIIALFKPCRPEDLPAKETEASLKLDCYKDAAEYKERYKRGLLCYLRDETIVGFAFWNMPPIEDRKDVATEILRSRPNYKDINIVADLLGFSETHCVYLSAEEIQEQGPCFNTDLRLN